ncbi:sensor histidine kinase [Pseudonocardia spinosispora]|uniref:sensor histidine kinase n=1 Tax=Pseudonocardia spinosispora TaxID=103441 RepID=UPI00040F378F|nr:HAMP domain-containing sensor histidine kinase [Pseudonocardia spinosispora]
MGTVQTAMSGGAQCSWAILTAAAVSMTVAFAYLVGRLGDDRRWSWISAVAALHGVLMLACEVPAVTGVSALISGVVLLRTGWWSSALRSAAVGAMVVGLAHGVEALSTGAGHNVPACASLGGVLLVLSGVLQRMRSSMRAVDTEREELELARLTARRTAERDHEVRNAVAGLAGAAHVLGGRRGADDRAEAALLASAMTSELARVTTLLEGTLRHRVPGGAPLAYRVRPVLRRQIALRRSAGMDIKLKTDLGLGAFGRPAVLTQVLANLLANCATHAPGSPVLIEARRKGDVVCIKVSDDGPGVAVLPGQDVFGSGVRGEGSAGQGLGLHISRQLIETDGGGISIRPRSVSRPGCTVEIQLSASSHQELPVPAPVRRAS